MNLLDASDVAPGLLRCAWPGEIADYVRYHDEEWGVPVAGDVAYFERLTFESFQSGLSWLIVMRKRATMRAAFQEFDPVQLAAFGEADVERLLADAGIIRNRAKVLAAIRNARALVRLWDAQGPGALERLMLDHRPSDEDLRAEGFRRPPQSLSDIPSATAASRALAKRLKALQFVFVGPITLHAGMQANGLVNDHLAGCFRRAALTG